MKPYVAIPCTWLTLALAVRAQTALSEWRTGIATHYGGAQDGKDPSDPSFGTKEGECGYGLLNKGEYPFWSVAALSTSNEFFGRGPVNGCGECFEVECIDDGPEFAGRCNPDPSQRSVTVMITDACPECEADHMDIQALTFNRMAPMDKGRIAMRYRQVECSPPGSIKVTIDNNYGTNRWLHLIVENVAGVGAIRAVWIKGQNSDWSQMSNSLGVAWEMGNAPAPPLDIWILDAVGNKVIAAGAIQDTQSGTFSIGVQFSSSYTASGASGFNQFSSLNEASGASAASSSSSPNGEASVTVTASSGPEEGSSSSGQSASSSDATESGSTASGSSSPLPSSSSSNESSSSTDSSSGSQPPPSSSGFDAQNTLRGSEGSRQPSSPGNPSWGSSTQSPSPPPPSWGSASAPPSPGSSPSSGNSCYCDDQQPPGGYSCSQQKAWGACSEGWMWQYAPDRPNGYCASTCGSCKC